MDGGNMIHVATIVAAHGIKGEVKVKSFTAKKGNRPSFLKAAKPILAIPLYEQFVETLAIESRMRVVTGIFGEDMKIALLNDGPVTILMDSKNRE